MTCACTKQNSSFTAAGCECGSVCAVSRFVLCVLLGVALAASIFVLSFLRISHVLCILCLIIIIMLPVLSLTGKSEYSRTR